MSIIAAGDNAEILDIRVYVKSDYSVKVSLEGGIERFKKIFGLSHDVSTGNEELDKKYVFKTKSNNDKSLLKSIEFQQNLKKLQPFSYFEISKFQTLWMQALCDKSQFDFAEIERYMRVLIETAKIIANRDSKFA